MLNLTLCICVLNLTLCIHVLNLTLTIHVLNLTLCVNGMHEKMRGLYQPLYHRDIKVIEQGGMYTLYGWPFLVVCVHYMAGHF